MVKEGTQQVPAFKLNGRYTQEPPVAGAQSGWSNFLTWRKPKASTSTINSDSIKTTPPSQGQTRAAPQSRHSPQSGQQQKVSGRSRAPIPFDLGPRRTPSSTSTNSINDLFTEGEGSTSVLEVENGLKVALTEEEDAEEEDILALNSAFESLSRVKRKAGDSQNAFQGTRSPSSSSRQNIYSIDSSSSTSDTAASGSWLAWGSSTIRSTLPRGVVVPSLFLSNSAKDLNNITFSPITSSNTTDDGIPSEKWRPNDADDIGEHVDRMISFAGIDGSLRSIVTLSAPNLPPANQVSHDMILQRILLRTQPLVENPGSGYTLILFASGADLIDGSHCSKTIWPGWTWCWKAWRSLGRSYRKNLKRLYIVHPTFFTKTLVRLISTGSYFVSPKFARKIVQCDTLHDLGNHIPLHQLDIPPEVLIWDLKMGAKEESEKTNEFDDIATIPTNVRDCIEALKGSNGTKCLLDIEGIFRVPPSYALLQSAKYAYRLNRRPNLTRFVEKDVHLPAALLKSSLRTLPLPLFPSYLYPTIERCPTTSEEDMLHYLRHNLLPTLDEGKLILLSYILQCLHEVSLRSDKNRMDSFNLSTVVTPNLVRSEDAMKDVAMCRVQRILKQGQGDWEEDNKTQTITNSTATLGSIIAFCISHYYEVFDEVDLDMPILNFGTDRDQKRGSLGTLSSNSKKPFVQRNFSNTSSPLQGSTRNGIMSPYSPSTKTLSNKHSSNSLRVKNRITSGGSLRGGVNLVDKGIQSVALVGTSATGEFGKPNIVIKRSSLELEEQEDDGDESLQELAQASPTIHPRKVTPSNMDGLRIQHDRRPLSEVFEE